MSYYLKYVYNYIEHDNYLDNYYESILNKYIDANVIYAMWFVY